MRDITLADTVYIGFTTRAFATGIPTVLSGTPVVSAYEDAGLTQITAGITLGVDHDGVVGLNMLTIVATGANGFEDNKDYNLVITTGTVGGVSVVGEVVGQFSIQRSPVNWANVSNPTTAVDLSGTDIQLVDTVTTYTGNTLQTADIATNVPNVLNTTALGNIGIDWANVENPTTALDLSGTDIQLVDTATDVTNQVTANVTAISGDTTAADNLELQYDTTGLSGDSFPASQAQVGNIATGSAAISVIASSRTLTTGSEVNAYTDTFTKNGTYHEISDAAGALELYYEFDVTGNGVGSEISMWGRLFSANDTIGVYAYNWAGTSWDQIGTMPGSGASTDIFSTFNLLVSHTGTGANLGLVRVRGYAASGLSSSTLYIDQAYVSYAVVAQSVGYSNGQVWVDTVDGTAGTESYVNGVADNPVLTFADAITIADALSIHDFHFTPHSTLTLAANLQDRNVYGIGYTLNFAGFDCSGTHFFHASPVNGVVLSGGSDHVDIIDSIIEDVTCNDAHFTNCSFKENTLTFATVSSTVRLINCRSLVAGGNTPTIDFGTTAATNHNLTIADWQNGIQIANFNTAGTDLMSMSGTGQLIIAASCAGGTINLRGQWKITDNSGGAVTIVRDDVATSIIAIEADTDELQTDWTDGGRLDLLLDRLITEMDTARGEPAQGAPAASTKIGDKIDYLYKAWRNKTEQTATTLSVYDDAGTTVDHKSTVSDDATTATRGEIVSGP